MRILAFSYLAFALVVTLAARDPTLSLGPDVVTRAFIPTDRENLGPSRLLHLLAIALLFSRLVPAKWEGFQSPVHWPTLCRSSFCQWHGTRRRTPRESRRRVPGFACP